MTKDALKTIAAAILEPATSCKCKLLVEQDGNHFAVVAMPSPADMPRLIGTSGKNFAAVRGILEFIGYQNQVRIRYFVREPYDQTDTPKKPTKPFDPEAIRAMAKRILGAAKLPTEVLMIYREDWWILSPAAELPSNFAGPFGRWVDVCSKSQGGLVAVEAQNDKSLSA